MLGANVDTSSRPGRSLHPYHDRSERTKMKMRNNPGTEVFAQTASSTDEAATADTKRVAPGQSLSARNRRKFLKGGMFAAGATVLGAGLSPSRLLASDGNDDRAPITKGDIAILQISAGLRDDRSRSMAAVLGARWNSGQRSQRS